MMRSYFATISFAFALATVAVPAFVAAEEQAKSKTTTIADLQGTWSFVYYEEKGEVQEPGAKQFAISKNQLDFRNRGETRVATSIEVDSTQTPVHFTQKFKDGQVYRSILTQAGDFLILCGNRDSDRPSKFEAGTEKGGEFLIILKREK